MFKIILFFTLIFSSFQKETNVAAKERPVCEKVRFSNVGWSDISVTTALASLILETLGYNVKISELSVPVTYVSLKNNDIDIFLGNWMPTMSADIKPYLANKSVEVLSPILTGARYTLAVPKYVYNAGVHNFSDLNRFKDKFSKKIYGIEPGNDGNRQIQNLIRDKEFKLADWKLVESSEQAMLMQVFQAVRSQQWIVYLGWEPHPMNTKIDMVYLEGGEKYFGANQGVSNVYINTRKNYALDCPNITTFLKQYSLSISLETKLISYMLDQKKSARATAEQWLQNHFTETKPWLTGVTTRSGEDAYTVILKKWSKIL